MASHTQGWTLTNQITEHMVRPRQGDARPPNLWPSEATAVLTNTHGEPEVQGSCRRHTYLRYAKDQVQFDHVTNAHLVSTVDELKALEVEPDKYMRWIWAAGNLFEDFVIEQAKQSGVYCADQVQIVIPAYQIVGKLDLLVVNPLTGGIIAQEVKSIYGHNTKGILGTPGMHNRQQSGTPREGNMMQLAIYDWHLRKRMGDLEVSRLFYGARDTGRFGEFDIITEFNPQTGETEISYQMVSPFLGPKVKSPITVDNILNQYSYVLAHYETATLPPRDYSLVYSQEHIQRLYERGDLGKTDSEAQEKILSRVAENEALVAAGKAPKKELKRLEKGDWNCSLCNFTKFCYDDEGKPRHG